MGRLALRASATVGTPVGVFDPHLHCGASAALAVGARWRVLGEAIVTISGGRAALSAGPAVKLALDAATSLQAGALLGLAQPTGAPALAVQLTRSL